jgi:hypothetical protein
MLESALRAAIYAWIRCDANMATKMTISPELVAALVNRIMKVLPPPNHPDLPEISP